MSKKQRLQKKRKKLKQQQKAIAIFKQEKDQLFNISFVFFLFFLIFLLVVFSHISMISLTHTIKGENLSLISQEQYTATTTLDSTRGTIYDASNNILAVNIKEYKLSAVLNKKNTKYDDTTYTYKPYYIENPKEDAQKIIEILGYEDDETAKELITSQLAMNSDETFEVEFGKYGENISLEQKEELEAANINGLYFEEKNERYYPYGDLASYVIGYAKQYTSTDDSGDTSEELVGEMGIEKLLNSYLKGVDGKVKVVKDKNGVPIKQEQILKSKENGEDIYLTLDSTIQSYVHDYMSKYLKGEKYTSAITTVVDAKTGAILGAEKFPNFDPNTKDITDYNDPYTEICFEPGSVMKTFVVASAILENVWDGEATFPSGKREKSSWGVGDHGQNYIADWLYNEKGYGWGTISFNEGYYFSSNVAMTYVLDNIGYSKWLDYATNTFEFGKPYETELFSTNSCTFNPKVDFEIANTVFGQGMTVNVLQLIRAYTTFTGDGRMVNPYIINKIVDSDTGEVVYEGKSDKPSSWEEGKNNVYYDKKTGQYYKQILTKEQNKQILELMKGVSYYNTGGNFQGTGYVYGSDTTYEIASKTGTSQVAVNGSYNNSKTIHSAVVMAPADDPQIMIYTAVYDPKDTYPQRYIGEYLGPIIDDSLDYLNKKNIEEIEEDNQDTNTMTLANYIGQDEKTIKNEELNYTYFGTGKVKYQYPTANSLISKAQKVYLIGEKITTKEFINMKAADVPNICIAMDITCELKNKGEKVVGITKEEEKYVITTK
ncbi:MAG: peptidoglycan D,D-transpeptidase FtsI family protein [Mycoplasmatales bacterium]